MSRLSLLKSVIGIVFSAVLPVHIAQAQRLELKDCSSAEQARIRTQLKWLRLNQRELIERIKTRQPEAFSGRSEARLTAFFRTRITKVQCSRDTVVCAPDTTPYEIDELTFPLPHRYPLTLCMNYLQDDDVLTIALAHQLGRHILINQDKTECTERCTAPNLAVLFSQTAHAMLSGHPFSMEWCLTSCAPPRETSPVGLPTLQGTELKSAIPASQASGQIDEMPQAPRPNTDP